MNMRITSLVVAIVLTASVCFAQTTRLNIKFTENGGVKDTPVISGKSGEVTYKIEPSQGEFFGSPVIKSPATARNTGKVKVEFSLALAYFDAAGNLLGACSQSTDLGPDEESMMGSLLAHVPDNTTWKKVVSCQVVSFARKSD